MSNFHALGVEECLLAVGSKEGGLVKEEAEKRLISNGKNIIESDKKRNLFLLFFKQFIDVMILVLIVAGVVSIILAVLRNSSSEAIDAGIIFGIVLLNGILGFVQELKADNSIRNLKTLSVPEAKVIRDGQLVKISSKDVVVGDIVFIEAGDIIPADLRILEAIHLKCDESSLTGESTAVEKTFQTLDERTVLADRKNMGYRGTNVTHGRGYGLVIATGMQTEMGRIAGLLKQKEKQVAPIQKDLKKLGIFLTIAVAIITIMMFVLEAVKPGADYAEAFMIAVAVAVAAIPESLSTVVTIIMSIGVSRLAKKKAIVKNLNSIETLGCCQIICSDKTGTLTENKMKVSAVYDNDEIVYKIDKISKKEFSLQLQNILKVMALCNTCAVQNAVAIGDPTEVALCDFASQHGYLKNQLQTKYKLMDEFSFDSHRKLMTTIHEIDGQVVSLTKGGLDEVLACCDKIMVGGKTLELDANGVKKILCVGERMAKRALRVLGFAVGNAEEAERNMTFVGLSGMIDPPREEAAGAVKSCFKAGMIPIMITGDHKDTAFEIAKQLGIAKSTSEVMLGSALDKLSDEEFLKVVQKIKVYARVTPENKVRIVQTYRKLGKIVAMTGDGVNDAPCIKSADIGIGMGITGTDISKEAADIVVADDNFATIIIAVEEGRRVYKNIEKTVRFLLSANGAEILSILFITIFFPNLIFLLPVHILFINLVTDSIPSIALGFEPPEKEIMMQEPRKTGKHILGGSNGVYVAVFAIVQAAIIISIYWIGLSLFGESVARSMAFYAFNIVQLFYIVSARTDDYVFKSNIFQNKWMLFSLTFGIVILLITVLTPLHSILHLVGVNYVGWLICIGLSAVILPICELYKLIYKKISQKKSKKV